jgi:hypothetical protein
MLVAPDGAWVGAAGTPGGGVAAFMSSVVTGGVGAGAAVVSVALGAGAGAVAGVSDVAAVSVALGVAGVVAAVPGAVPGVPGSYVAGGGVSGSAPLGIV